MLLFPLCLRLCGLYVTGAPAANCFDIFGAVPADDPVMRHAKGAGCPCSIAERDWAPRTTRTSR